MTLCKATSHPTAHLSNALFLSRPSQPGSVGCLSLCLRWPCNLMGLWIARLHLRVGRCGNENIAGAPVQTLSQNGPTEAPALVYQKTLFSFSTKYTDGTISKSLNQCCREENSTFQETSRNCGTGCIKLYPSSMCPEPEKMLPRNSTQNQ